jgi:hypothetical protein
VSLDRGGSWTKLNNNLPTVAVHEIAVHPTAGEIVAATHGRSLWILDVTALRQMASEKIATEPTLYRPNTVTRWQPLPRHGSSGRQFVGQNPPPGAHIYYSLPQKAAKVTLEFQDVEGKKIAEMTGPTTPGLHRVTWSTRGGTARPGVLPPLVPAGTYRVVLNVDGQTQVRGFSIEGDPVPERSLRAEEEEEDEQEEAEAIK